MDIKKLNATIKNPRTTDCKLNVIYFSNPDLPADSIAMMAKHPRIEPALLSWILTNDGHHFNVAFAVATRTSMLTFTPLRELACMIRDNTHNWSREELEQIFEEFKKHIPADEPFGPYYNWRELSYDQVAVLCDDDDEDDDDFYDCTGDEDDYDEFWNDDDDDQDEDYARGDYEYDPVTDAYYDEEGNEVDYVEASLAEAWDDAMEK